MPSLFSQPRERLRNFLMQDHNLLLLAAVIGFLAGFASTLFRWMIAFFESIFSGTGLTSLSIPECGLFPECEQLKEADPFNSQGIHPKSN